MRDNRKFDPFRKPICRLEAVASGAIVSMRGMPGVHIGKEKTYALCNLIPVEHDGICGGLWKVESSLIKRADYYRLLANEVAIESFGRIFTGFKGQPLTRISNDTIRRLGLRTDRQWVSASREMVAVEANPYHDTVKPRHCLIAQRGEDIFYRELYLPIIGTSTVMKVGYHTYNGDLSKLVAEELGQLSDFCQPIILALDRAHGH